MDSANKLNFALRRDTNDTEALLKSCMNAYPEDSLLRRSMEYSLFAGGKRIRPFLCLETASLYGEKYRSAALPAAAGLEMIHTYSLIHDDLPAMDNDDYRRGKLSNHKAFGEANAILAGDGLLSFAFKVVSSCASPAVFNVITSGALDMVEGQSLDLNPIDTEEALYRIHTLKTGALIKSAVLSGAYCAGAGKEDIEHLSAFASHYGLLFQITDDILDVIGDPHKLGKTTGKDETENKFTFVTCYGLTNAQERAKAEANESHSALVALNRDCEVLHELIDYTINRDK